MAQVVAPWLGPVESSRFLAGTEQKLRGGYYTPDEIASILALWTVRAPDARVLEPSCGDGQLVEAVAKHLGPSGSICGIELFPEESAKAAARGGGRAEIATGDFFAWFLHERPERRFDAVVGNPPFLRFHSFPEEHRESAFAVMKNEGLHPSRLTNAWVPFVVASTAALVDGGRLGLVLPAELLQVSYASELREYLSRKFRRLVIVTFQQIIFEGTQQETVLLFGVRGDGSAARMKWIELDDAADVKDIDRLAALNGVAIDLDHAREKWTQYYLSPDELDLVREVESSPKFTTLGALAEVDVGVVTGNNDFFVLTQEHAMRLGIVQHAFPLVSRSAHIPGIELGRGEWDRLRDGGQRTLLLQLPAVPREHLDQAAAAYIESGEELGAHIGYKCRIRLPIWWEVPSVWVPDAFMLRQIHEGPRVVANTAGVTCTDTIHRLRTRTNVAARWLAAASLNSLTFAFAEIRGRSYGGGVLELEPSEAESLPFPRLTADLPFDEIDGLIRQRRTEDALDLVDRVVLRAAGLGSTEIDTLRGIWKKLSGRRVSRRGRRKRPLPLLPAEA